VTAALVAAILARIKAGKSGLGVTAYDAHPDAPTYPYCVVFLGAGVGRSERESGVLSVRDVAWDTVTVGISAGQCRAAVDRVVAALEGWRPIPDDPSCPRVQHPTSQPVRPDETVSDRTLFIATDQWRVAPSA
jgi:hypothetical protein